MDYNLPIAKRTRSREALMYRKLHEVIRKKRRQEKNGFESSCLKVDEWVLNEKANVVEEEETDVDSVVGGSDCELSETIRKKKTRKKKKQEKCGFEVHKPFFSEKVNVVESKTIDMDSVQENCNDVHSLRVRGIEKTLLDDSEDELIFVDDEDDLGSEKSEEDSNFFDGDDEQMEKGDDDDDDLYIIDVDDEEGESVEEMKNDNKSLRGERGENAGKLRKSVKRKRNCRIKDDNVQKILINSILNMEEILKSEDSLSMGYEVSEEQRNELASEVSLPLQFTFGIEESSPVEKSEYEKENDNLWAEMEFARTVCEITSTDFSMVENEGILLHKLENQANLCQLGKHEPILDEEIGIVCRFCSVVMLEIKYVMPSFDNFSSNRSNWRDPNMVDHAVLDELHSHESGFDLQPGLDPCSHPHGTVWDLIPGVKNSMYPHQCDGFEFIWKNIAGGVNLDELKSSTKIDGGNGCIISHAPGTGKSRLTIVFLQSYMRLYPKCRPVIVAPRSMLLTWEEEFQKWGIDIPFHSLNKPELSGKENSYAVSLINQKKHGEGRVKLVRMVKLFSWIKYTGILGVSYRLFDKLVNVEEKSGKSLEKDCNSISKILLELPGLFVFDEGHIPRNNETAMFKSLSKIKTERRIILSGTPFQNNFEELDNILGLVLPKFADKKRPRNQRHMHEKCWHKRNRERGIFASLTGYIGKVPDKRLEEELEERRNMIAPFVHVHKGSVLLESLPGLRHSVVVLLSNDFQKSLFEAVRVASKGSFDLNYRVSLISVHPSLLPDQCLENEDFIVYRDKLERLRLDPEAGIKTKFLLKLLRLSDAVNEKVLVFSQYIEPLTLIMEQLKHSLSWVEGKEVLYMDGKRDVKQRQYSINVFNDPMSEVRVLLASTRACCEGINLVGASRVVLLDVVWNPSLERQAISRAYRLGQKRLVHVYQLITSEKTEAKKYLQKVMKDRWSNLVFSSDRGDNKQTAAFEDLQDQILDEMVHCDKLIEKIIRQPKESELIGTFGFMDK